MSTWTNVTSTVRSLITIRIRENLSIDEYPLRFTSSNEQSFLCLTQIRFDRCSSNSRIIINFQNSEVATPCSQTTHPWKIISWGPVLVIKVICVQLRHPLIDVDSTTGPLLTREVQESFLSDCSNY